MSIYAAPNTTLEASVDNAPTGLTGTIGVRIEDGQGGTTQARQTTGIVESPAGSGIYTATLTAPSTAGTYWITWDTGDTTVKWAIEDLNVTSTSAPGPLPSGTDLVTLAQVRAFLQKNDSANTTQDPVIQELITRASTQINRDIAYFPAETNTAKTFVWRGGPIGLHPYFLRSTPTVALDTDTSSPQTLATTDYQLRPKPARDGMSRWINFPYLAQNTSNAREREVTLTADWGFTEIPADVQHWTIVTVAVWLRRDVSAFSTTLRLDEDRLERPDSLPSAARRGLAKYATPRGI